MEKLESYPLCWPDGWKRMPLGQRVHNGSFKQSLARYREDLYDSLDRLGATRQIVSSNVPIRGDGKLYANSSEPSDSGVAVYFQWRSKRMCFACDKFQTVAQNIRAITLTIEAIRGIERWGASDMMERAFRGFTAIEAHPWKTTLGIEEGHPVSKDLIEERFRAMARVHHPDVGGNEEKFKDLTHAREAGLASLGVTR